MNNFNIFEMRSDCLLIFKRVKNRSRVFYVIEWRHIEEPEKIQNWANGDDKLMIDINQEEAVEDIIRLLCLMFNANAKDVAEQRGFKAGRMFKLTKK